MQSTQNRALADSTPCLLPFSWLRDLLPNPLMRPLTIMERDIFIQNTTSSPTTKSLFGLNLCAFSCPSLNDSCPLTFPSHRTSHSTHDPMWQFAPDGILKRHSIEAKGIADFQTIVAAGISEQLLRWKGIEATEKIANSPNTKVIIVGAGRDGLPVILDTK